MRRLLAGMWQRCTRLELEILGGKLEQEVRERLAEVVRLRPAPGAPVDAVREHVEAMLGL